MYSPEHTGHTNIGIIRVQSTVKLGCVGACPVWPPGGAVGERGRYDSHQGELWGREDVMTAQYLQVGYVVENGKSFIGVTSTLYEQIVHLKITTQVVYTLVIVG